jgi:hypothetical protein
MPKAKTEYQQKKRRALLLGCGKSRDKRMKFEGSKRVGRGSPDNDFTKYELVTHDINPRTDADVLHDLEEFPYPWKDGEFDEIHAYEVLEHCGWQGDGDFFFKQMHELHRILKEGGYLMITVPAWDSLEMWGCPDHRRALPPQIFQFCNKKYVETTAKRPMGGDYRDQLGNMNFEFAGVEEDKSHCGIVLRKVK